MLEECLKLGLKACLQCSPQIDIMKNSKELHEPIPPSDRLTKEDEYPEPFVFTVEEKDLKEVMMEREIPEEKLKEFEEYVTADLWNWLRENARSFQIFLISRGRAPKKLDYVSGKYFQSRIAEVFEKTVSVRVFIDKEDNNVVDKKIMKSFIITDLKFLRFKTFGPCNEFYVDEDKIESDSPNKTE